LGVRGPRISFRGFGPFHPAQSCFSFAGGGRDGPTNRQKKRAAQNVSSRELGAGGAPPPPRRGECWLPRGGAGGGHAFKGGPGGGGRVSKGGGNSAVRYKIPGGGVFSTAPQTNGIPPWGSGFEGGGRAKGGQPPGKRDFSGEGPTAGEPLRRVFVGRGGGPLYGGPLVREFSKKKISGMFGAMWGGRGAPKKNCESARGGGD